MDRRTDDGRKTRRDESNERGPHNKTTTKLLNAKCDATSRSTSVALRCLRVWSIAAGHDVQVCCSGSGHYHQGGLAARHQQHPTAVRRRRDAMVAFFDLGCQSSTSLASEPSTKTSHSKHAWDGFCCLAARCVFR